MANAVRLSNGLTQQQLAFFNNVLKQIKEVGRMDVTKAAVEAGYSVKSSPIIGARLWKNPRGQAYLKSLHDNCESSSIATLEWVMDKLIRVVKLGIPDDPTIKSHPNELNCSIRAISEINKIKGYYAPE